MRRLKLILAAILLTLTLLGGAAGAAPVVAHASNSAGLCNGATLYGSRSTSANQQNTVLYAWRCGPGYFQYEMANSFTGNGTVIYISEQIRVWVCGSYKGYYGHQSRIEAPTRLRSLGTDYYYSPIFGGYGSCRAQSDDYQIPSTPGTYFEINNGQAFYAGYVAGF